MITKPANTTLYDGDDHVFLCEVKGRPSPTVIWQKDGVVLINSTNILISETMNDPVVSSKFTLYNATLKDIGLYECNGVNSLGEVTEVFSILVYGMLCEYQWSVHPHLSFYSIAAVAILHTTQETHVIIDDSLVLNCTVNGNPPPREITWTAHNSQYTSMELSLMADEIMVDEFTVFSSLFLPYVTLESRGNYSCATYNEFNNNKWFDQEIIPVFVLGE